jgi:hypothetical protein
LRASGFLFNVLTDGLLGVEAGMWLLSAVVLIYVASGGLRAVAYVDTIQCLLLAFGIVAIGWATLNFVGGWGRLNEGIAALAQTDINRTPDGYSHYLAIPGVIQWVPEGTKATGGAWTGMMILMYMFALMGIQSAPAFSMWAFANRNPKPFAPQQVWAFSFCIGLILLVFTAIQGGKSLEAQDPGGIDILNADFDIFYKLLKNKNHTLKRALTDPHLLSGISNAYSDEIFHRPRLSPIAMTKNLTKEETRILYNAARATLTQWVNTLREETGDKFPDKVTAFRDGMSVHGRFKKPCPNCKSPIQRIRYKDNETHYCPTCQTHGKLLADRALSRLLKKDWPKTLEEIQKKNSFKAI